MSLRSEVLEEVRGIASSGLASIVDAVERRRAQMESQPALWYRFHTEMARRVSGRPFGALRVRWHMNRALRFEALARAAMLRGNPIACRLCEGTEAST